MNDVRLCRIEINNLFGRINYDIKLFDDECISIFTAPNGCGKTTILKLLSFLFAPDKSTYDFAKKIPFDQFRCHFTNGKVVELIQHRRDGYYSFDGRKIKPPKPRNEGESELLSASSLAFRIATKDGKSLQAISYAGDYQEALEKSPGELLGTDEEVDEEIYDTDPKEFFKLVFPYLFRQQRELLQKENCGPSVKLISANRIQVAEQSFKDGFGEEDGLTLESPLKIASKQMATRITEATEQYGEAVSQAKDRMPQMFIDGEGGNLSFKEFMRGWAAYQKKLKQYHEIGLIRSVEDFTAGKNIEDVYKEKGSFLSTYLSAFKETTGVLKDIYDRMSLFKKILDERNAITGKAVKMSRNGIAMVANGREIDLDSLSSGEKNDFVMFYDLIFNTVAGGLVLIDEPEISLHIEWQETYLDNLMTICKMNHLKAIVATHSPSIVGSHYDLIVDKGENNESN